ncbi:DUF6479 family protein [Streptomyces kanamyceticus]|uniref:DUF6479 family protein n=1 Tax=Streptomyces kanamyceticus TaxID=1967 RepID=UPI0037DCD984
MGAGTRRPGPASRATSVWFGARVRNRERVPPRPEEQPRPPAGGPVDTGQRRRRRRRRQAVGPAVGR